MFSVPPPRSPRSCPNAETATLIPAFSYRRRRFRGGELRGAAKRGPISEGGFTQYVRAKKGGKGVFAKELRYETESF
jgi:hypothetical protein